MKTILAIVLILGLASATRTLTATAAGDTGCAGYPLWSLGDTAPTALTFPQTRTLPDNTEETLATVSVYGATALDTDYTNLFMDISATGKTDWPGPGATVTGGIVTGTTFTVTSDTTLNGARLLFSSDVAISIQTIALGQGATAAGSAQGVHFFTNTNAVTSSADDFDETGWDVTSTAHQITLTANNYATTGNKQACIVADPVFANIKSLLVIISSILNMGDAMNVGSVQLYSPACDNNDVLCALCGGDSTMPFYDTSLDTPACVATCQDGFAGNFCDACTNEWCATCDADLETCLTCIDAGLDEAPEPDAEGVCACPDGYEDGEDADGNFICSEVQGEEGEEEEEEEEEDSSSSCSSLSKISFGIFAFALMVFGF